ncbi:carbamoyltransferase C-terminal domain-containing protein [Streptomyces sp. bgisy095]|uniref:carbamoyltransferase C-terminal domain-containing protein n=1 Tax=unclassified Streptomyces TaxID=2593676 RepID=UPI003D7187BF
MTTVLGIHCGHESSCSVVRDGRLLSAVQQERVTRRKYDGQEFLSDRLPIQEALRLAGTTMDEVDVIVSSFQAAGPSGVGLQRPLVSPSFAAFDPFDPRHHVVSHHLAHAASAVYPSGFPAAAVLVSDSAGTTSWDGRDFYEPFAAFHGRYYADAGGNGGSEAGGDAVPVGAEGPADRAVFTEMRSFYAFRNGGFTLLDRAYSVPHNQPDVFVQSEASLFDNVSRYVFRTEHAHGQLMALAGLPPTRAPRLSVPDVVTEEEPPRLRNGWQLLDGGGGDPVEQADVAAVVQEAFTRLLTHHARRAVELAGIADLACAGGVFLNLTANSEIAALPEVNDLYVPSCPHDAGISVGAAFLGWARAQEPGAGPPPRRIRGDFLGRPAERVGPALAREYGYVPVPIGLGDTDEDGTRGPGAPAVSPHLTRAAAEVIARGAVVARFAGRAEFGPRALGNRSLLCHPVACADARAKLNLLKRRQDWRPVAPIVRAEDLDTYFHGPAESPFMNFNFRVRREYADLLAEALHADGTARVQTVAPEYNPAIHALLTALAELGLPPVLINTSLNGPGQPIIDSAEEVLEFVRHPVVDHLLGEDYLIATPDSGPLRVRRPESVVMAAFGSGSSARYVLSSGDASSDVDRQLFLDLCAQDRALADGGSRLVLDCLSAGLLVEADR